MTQTSTDPGTTAGIADAPIRLTLGIAVDAIDGLAGEVDGIVIDPRSQRVTDLVVRMRVRDDARLIPIDAIASCGEHIALSWSLADIDHAQPVREIALRRTDQQPNEDEFVTAGMSRTFGWSSFGTVRPLLAQGALGRLATLPPTIYDAIPAGRAEVGRGSDIFSNDNNVVGHVRGVIIERDGTITHVVLGRGHLWARREVDVLVGHVDSFVSDRVHLRIGRDVVDTFPVTAPRRHDHNLQPVPASTPRIP